MHHMLQCSSSSSACQAPHPAAAYAVQPLLPPAMQHVRCTKCQGAMNQHSLARLNHSATANSPSHGADAGAYDEATGQMLGHPTLPHRYTGVTPPPKKNVYHCCNRDSTGTAHVPLLLLLLSNGHCPPFIQCKPPASCTNCAVLESPSQTQHPASINSINFESQRPHR
jgi:hypothetical protein